MIAPEGGARTTRSQDEAPGNAGRKGGALLAPFYAYPLARFAETIAPVVTSVRTLPGAQLVAELDQLTAICAAPGDHLAERLMRRIYQGETARRSNPAMLFDDQLDAALSRLERATNDADRQLVWMIGTDLFAMGGFEAMKAAEQRMLALAKPARRELRQRTIEKRWSGIGAINAR